MVRPRLTRAEHRELTRARLLEAASRVLRERGHRGASVEAIAGEAGYTVGALYSNFGGKEDLLLALLEQEIARIVDRMAAAAGEEGGTIERLRRGALEWMAFLDEEPELYALLIDLWTIWVRDPERRPEHARRFAAVRRAIGEPIEEEIRRLGLSPRMPAEHVGAAVVALADGLALQRLADPEAIPDDLLASVLAALVPALGRAPQR